jgi:hypothetical protein
MCLMNHVCRLHGYTHIQLMGFVSFPQASIKAPKYKTPHSSHTHPVSPSGSSWAPMSPSESKWMQMSTSVWNDLLIPMGILCSFILLSLLIDRHTRLLQTNSFWWVNIHLCSICIYGMESRNMESAVPRVHSNLAATLFQKESSQWLSALVLSALHPN